MKYLIEELQELQATLKNDGYKDWCYAQLTIDKAIKVVKNCNIPHVIKSVCEITPICMIKIDDENCNPTDCPYFE